MSSSNLIRGGGIAAIMAGLIFIVLVLSNPQGEVGLSLVSSSLATVLFIIALLGQLAAMVGLYILQRVHDGRLGTAGSLVALVGFVLLPISIVSLTFVSEMRGIVIVLALLIAASFAAFFIGLVLLGIAILRTRMLPSWFGVLLIAGLIIVGVLVGIGQALIGVIAYVVLGFQSTRCGTWTQDVSAITSSKTSFGDGTYIVGTDIDPGTYRNSGSAGCYYVRLSGFTHDFSNIIANQNTDAQAVVTIAPTDARFQSKRCGTWTNIE